MVGRAENVVIKLVGIIESILRKHRRQTVIM